MTRELPEKFFRDNDPPPRKTRFIFKLFAFLIVLLAAWMGWYFYRNGSVPDLTDAAQQKKILAQAQRDLTKAQEKATEFGGKAADALGKAADWASRGIEDVRQRINGKPPETKEEVSALVKDSASTTPPAPQPPAPPVEAAKVVDRNPWDDTLQEAWSCYYRGVAEHSKSDPNNSREQVQAALAKAAPEFEKTLNLLDEVRAKGGKGSAIDDLEHRTAVRLYDCRKRRSVTEKAVRTP